MDPVTNASTARKGGSGLGGEAEEEEGEEGVLVSQVELQQEERPSGK